ncbi:MAG TPA: galactokinase family protein [Candidatus Deferrimicrobium sp.]|nr:galactokinase family protein [Candidatus Deferrimicrobium sp.]
MNPQEIVVRAPGRICLFGEHQDYLRLPVISAAISLFIEIRAVKTNDKKLTIDLLDLKQQKTIPLNNKEVPYEIRRDYLRSAYNQFIRKGFRLNQGYHCRISGTIPINAGVSSSSALVIAWITFLAHIFEVHLKPNQIAELGYQAEVDEFNEAGGMMDHFTAALGGLLYIQTTRPYICEQLRKPLTGFILGDSLQRKDTVSDLTHVREQVQIGMARLRNLYKDFNLKTTSLEKVSPYLSSLNPDWAEKITANLINRDLTQEARMLLVSNNFTPEAFGELLNLHHTQLSQNLGISTPKIELLIKAAKIAGALGCKINGSGFGGCMIAYAPTNEENVVNAIEAVGGKAYILSIGEGCKIYFE